MNRDALLVFSAVFTCTARSWANRGPHRSKLRASWPWSPFIVNQGADIPSPSSQASGGAGVDSHVKRSSEGTRLFVDNRLYH